ncbi:MAG TPA: primosomal protein N', partial [Chlamydiales bacterium]|nr:primosomal protein N' [Chlamydiales bacterium]
ILRDEIRIILGARSAIFCPAKNLGLIIVDEEHDSSYKQMEEAPCYHARDVALMRGKLENACVVLGSATPSFESYTHALRGKYILNTLTQRPAALLPKVKIIEMKQEMDKRGGFTHFSEELLNGLKQRALAGEQSLVLLNRRGYYTSIFCPACSLIQKCPDCAMAFAFHKGDNLLRCHLCDRTAPPLRMCPTCNKSTMEYKGFGTEHVERSLRALFPELRTLRMDRDTTQKKDAHANLISQFRSGKADVLIGTQMIAKGLHFPAVTLVGILNIDGALGIPDFRSSEYIFQLITQVAGRAGRANLPGEVIIQTYLPDHDTIQLAAKQDYKAFYEKELPMRKYFGYPPYSRFAKLVFSGPDEKSVNKLATDFRKKLLDRLNQDYEVFPISPAGHAKVKGNFRFQFLIKALKILPLTKVLQETRKETKFSTNTKLLIDIDPVATFF